MHLRRALLLFALVLGLTALAAAVSPTREESTSADEPERGAAVAPGTGSASGIAPRTIAFRARDGAEAAERQLRTGDHVIVSVASAEGGIATIPRLGRTASASPSAPARFDLLAGARGRYDVLFAPSSLDEPRRVGTLVVTGG